MKATLHRHQLVSKGACSAGLAVFDQLATGSLTLTWDRGGAKERGFREEYSIFWEWLEGKGLIADPLAPGVCPRCEGRASMHSPCAYCESSGKVPLAEDYVEAIRGMFGPHLSAVECLGMLREQAQRRAA